MIRETERVVGKRGGVIVVDGVISDELLDALDAEALLDSARTTARVLVTRLSEIGYIVRSGVPVADRGDGRGGRISIVAERPGERVAIETSDRAKSRVKLASLADATARVIVRSS